MPTSHSTATAALLILSLAAAGAPAASAMPIDQQTASAPRPAPAAVYSRQDKSTIPAAAPAQPTRLPTILPAPQPAQAAALRQAEQQERLAYVADHQSNSARYSSAEMNTYAAATPANTPTSSGPRSEVVSGAGYGSGTAAPTVVRVVDGASGFDWVDAAIGAAGGIALSMLGLGGARGVSQYRTRHTAALSG
jgi:hypothetical protein